MECSEKEAVESWDLVMLTYESEKKYKHSVWVGPLDCSEKEAVE